jgi:hypothetical protein
MDFINSDNLVVPSTPYIKEEFIFQETSTGPKLILKTEPKSGIRYIAFKPVINTANPVLVPEYIDITNNDGLGKCCDFILVKVNTQQNELDFFLIELKSNNSGYVRQLQAGLLQSMIFTSISMMNTASSNNGLKFFDDNEVKKTNKCKLFFLHCATKSSSVSVKTRGGQNPVCRKLYGIKFPLATIEYGSYELGKLIQSYYDVKLKPKQLNLSVS